MNSGREKRNVGEYRGLWESTEDYGRGNYRKDTVGKMKNSPAALLPTFPTESMPPAHIHTLTVCVSHVPPS